MNKYGGGMYCTNSRVVGLRYQDNSAERGGGFSYGRIPADLDRPVTGNSSGFSAEEWPYGTATAELRLRDQSQSAGVVGHGGILQVASSLMSHAERRRMAITNMTIENGLF
jgi:hypothetical protein